MDTDLYEVLDIPKTATASEIKKAYHRAALTSHPDKVPPGERETAEHNFKAIQKAYEILSDVSKREVYDQHGMSAFEAGSNGAGGAGFGAGVNMEDLFEQMFSGHGSGHGRRQQQQQSKGEDDVSSYEVSLEDMYRGKTTKFTITKRVICPTCSGSGGRERAKARKCATCDGKGSKAEIRAVGPGLVTQEIVACSTCSGRGSFYADKDKCKKCKGQRTVQQKKVLELYVPRGSREGDRIVFEQEADQVPDQEPGDVVFVLAQKEQDKFARSGNNLMTEIEITLLEALTGLNRAVVTHLDGRGIVLNTFLPNGRTRIIKPSSLLRVPGEGMPKKKSDARGDLFLAVVIQFPDDAWMEDAANVEKLKASLPKPGQAQDKVPVVVDEVEFVDAELMEFEREEEQQNSNGYAEDDQGEDMRGQPGCQQQ